MTTQEITLNQSSDAGLYTQLLRGRYVTSIDDGTSRSMTARNSTSTVTTGAAAAKAAGTGSNRSTSRAAATRAS